jgi:futalosine hydrolase
VRVLVVTAVPVERDAVLRGRPATPLPLPGCSTALRFTTAGFTLDALAAGVGPAAAATGASSALCSDSYDLVISAGIGGGFAGQAPLGSVVVADRIVAADLGAGSPTGFIPVEDLGFGTGSFPAFDSVRTGDLLRGAGLPVSVGPVLTVSTVTGTAGRAAELSETHGAVAEGMEGFGVATAAAAHGVPVMEIRTVSNPVGPRDRDAWRISDALKQLSTVFDVLVEEFRI